MTVVMLSSFLFRIIVGVTLLDSIIGLLLSTLAISILGAWLVSFYVSVFLSFLLILIYSGRVLVIFSYFVSLIRRLARNYFQVGLLLIISLPFFCSFTWGEASLRMANNVFCLFDENVSWMVTFIAFILIFALLGVVKLVGWSLGALRGFFFLGVNKNRSSSEGLMKVKILP